MPSGNVRLKVTVIRIISMDFGRGTIKALNRYGEIIVI